MDTDRFDAMLDAALQTGAIPAEASASERAEIEQMLAAAGQLRTAGAAAATEARAAMPIARARFERFLAAERTAALPAPAGAAASPRPGFFARVLTGHRTLSVGTMALLAILVAGGLLGSRAFFGDVETASALVPGDYAQVEGVVTSVGNEGGKRSLHVDSGLGGIDINVSESTSVLDEQNASDLSAVKPGATVLVGGVVVNARVIAARTLALSTGGVSLKAPKVLKFKELKELKGGLQGHVVTFSLAPDGVRARVLIETDGGDSYLVIVDGRSAERLLRLEHSLGAKVSVNAFVAGLFSLQVLDPAAPPAPGNPATTPVRPAGAGTVARPDAASTPGNPSLVKVSGVVLSRDGAVFVVQTRTGPLAIVVTAETRIFLGESGLTVLAVRNGESAIGHTVQVQGGLETGTGRVRADTVVVGAKVAR